MLYSEAALTDQRKGHRTQCATVYARAGGASGSLGDVSRAAQGDNVAFWFKFLALRCSDSLCHWLIKKV